MPTSSILKTLALRPEFAPPAPLESLAFSAWQPGLPVGALTQLRGKQATGMLLKFLGEHPQLRAVWVEETLTAYPPGLVQQGVDLERLLFVQGGKHFTWALHELVRSQAFKIVVAASALKGDTAGLGLRRLQIAARHAGAAVVLACELEGPLWPLKLRLETVLQQGVLRLRRMDRQEAVEATA